MRRFVAVLVVACVLAGCEGQDTPSSAPSITPTVAPTRAPSVAAPSPSPQSDVVREPGVLRGHFAIEGASMWIECLGTGSPTVILETGLGGDSDNWIAQQEKLSATTRVCRYDRAGLGQSTAEGITTITVGTRAAEMAALLEAAEIDGPYVLVGWSFGGTIVRIFAVRHGGEAAGLVFVDASHEDQLSDPWWLSKMSAWSDGGSRIVDPKASRAELLAAADLGATPTIVLSNGEANGDLVLHWAPLQDALAAMSTSSLHLVARDSGHDINGDQPELVRKVVEAVIATARTGGPLPACVGTFDTVGAVCLAGTMVEYLAAP